MFWSLLYDILTFTDLYNFVIATYVFMINIFEWMKHFWSRNRYIALIISEYIDGWQLIWTLQSKKYDVLFHR